MRRLLPAFVQRRMLLAAARRALAAGRPEAALWILADELLRDDPRASSLRVLAQPLVVPPPPVPTPPAPPRSAHDAETSGESRSLKALLASMRDAAPRAPGIAAAEGTRRSDAEAPLGMAGTAPAEGALGPESVGEASAPPLRLRLSIDDAGSFLLCAGETAILGHSRAATCDVPVLGDLLPRHARFSLDPATFHAGRAWRVAPIGDARVELRGSDLPAGGRSLRDGDRLRVGARLGLTFLRSDSSSESALLRLDAGVEAAGAQHVVLLAPGDGGRVRIGSTAACLVAAALGGAQIELSMVDGAWRLRSSSGLVPDGASLNDARTQFELPAKPARAVHLRVVMPNPADRPRWISFAPLEDP